MPLKSVEEITRERMVECIDSATQKFRSSVRPIYGANQNDRAEHIGSCLLLSVEGKKFLVTAAHVLDHRITTTLYVNSNRELVPLQGDCFQTVAVNGEREEDKYDFAFKELSVEEIEGIGSVNYIEKTSYNQLPTQGRIYQALGYPNSRNKPRQSIRTIAPSLYPYAATAKATPDHFFLSHDAEHCVVAETGERKRGFHPRGMSGGALLDLGQISKPANLTSPCTSYLAGMIIEKSQDSRDIVAVKIGVIMGAIKEKI